MNFINTIRKSKIRLALTSGVIACAIIFGGAYSWVCVFLLIRQVITTLVLTRWIKLPGQFEKARTSVNKNLKSTVQIFFGATGLLLALMGKALTSYLWGNFGVHIGATFGLTTTSDLMRLPKNLSLSLL